ncbi:phosphoadenylyl-sulfate reductase [Bacillus massiliigorillae]|uniref:phosphoadenylyl-sulfate reductase n=1 Tax=Bacillus massiliigorillae TaxID=1243664 RepID=UPI0005A971F0|nr:phosphoadenylyl-sulfate reductase [Bacillus massiliigorillae]
MWDVENLLYSTFKEENIPIFSEASKEKGAHAVLEWAYAQYGDQLLYACSFGVEGSVLLHLLSQVKPDAKVLFLDTGLHFKETYETIEKTKERYPLLRIEKKLPSLTVEEQSAQHGPELWKSNPDYCCQMRKVKPLEEELQKVDAWLSGLRREQSSTRQNVQFVNKDDRFQLIKICPLIHWTWDDIWAHVRKHDLPYNSLHDFDYPSIGCEPCTKAVTTNSRDGRWQGQGKLECGLHLAPKNKEEA